MKPATIIGAILIVIGIIGFAIGGFSFTHEKQDAKIGPLNIEHKETSTVPIPPILSGIRAGWRDCAGGCRREKPLGRPDSRTRKYRDG